MLKVFRHRVYIRKILDRTSEAAFVVFFALGLFRKDLLSVGVGYKNISLHLTLFCVQFSVHVICLEFRTAQNYYNITNSLPICLSCSPDLIRTALLLVES